MGFGGPVWHASAAPTVLPIHRETLEKIARQELEGVGDPGLGEWVHWTGRALHIRRRLTQGEQALGVGPVVDIRGDRAEVDRRLAPLRRAALLPQHWTE